MSAISTGEYITLAAILFVGARATLRYEIAHPIIEDTAAISARKFPVGARKLDVVLDTATPA